MSKFPVAPKPLAQPSTRRFHVFGAAGFVQESSQRSSNISWFDHVQFACASTQSKFEPRFYEGEIVIHDYALSLKGHEGVSFALPGMGLKVISQRYDLMSSKPSDTRSVPMLVRDAAVRERTLRSALESYNFQLRMMTALFRFSGDSGQIPLELWPSWRQEEENLSSVTWCLPSRRLRSAICLSDPIFQQEDLFAPATLDAARHAARDVSLYKGAQSSLPRRLRRLRGGPSLRLRHPGDALNLRLLLLRRSALKPPLLRSVLRPRRSRPIPRGGFGGRSLSPICGPVGFRGVAPHHRPVYPEHLHRISAISHGDSSVRPSFHSPRRLDDLLGSSGRVPPGSDPSGIASVSSLHHGRSLLSVQGAVLRVDNCPSGLYTVDGSNIRHSPSLRYQDALIPR